MSSSVPISAVDPTAPTPQNTPLVNAPITAGLSRPTIPETVSEEMDELEDIEDDDPVALLSVEAKRSLTALLGVQLKQTELQQEFKREVWALEKKYLERARPLYERRFAIISGSAPPTTEEIKAGEDTVDELIHGPLPEGDAAAPIPEFWLTALRNHIGISDLITDRDADALKHLTDIRLEYLEGDQLGFKLLFSFSPNEYFENEVLEKTYLYKPEIDYSGDFIYDRAVGTAIRWKEDKDLTKEFEVKKQRNKSVLFYVCFERCLLISVEDTNRVRLVRKARPVESFFNFFNPPAPPPEDEDEDELDEEALEAREELESRLELDYQIGEDIRDRIIPRAVDYFTGKALEYDAEDLSDDEFEDEDDSEDDDESGEDAPAGPRRSAKGRGTVKTEQQEDFPDEAFPIEMPGYSGREAGRTESQKSQGVVQLDLQRVVKRRVAKRQEGSYSEAADQAAIGLGDALDITYNVLVEVGNIYMPLVLDTGSADLWVLSSNCSTCSGAPYPLYPPDDFESVADARLLYGDSRTGTHAFGLIGADRIGVAELALEDQYFAAINETNTSVLDTGSAGIFGLGFPVNSLLWNELYTIAASGSKTAFSASKRHIPPRRPDLYSRPRVLPPPPPYFHSAANLVVGDNITSDDVTTNRLDILPSFSTYGPLVSRLVLNREFVDSGDASLAHLSSPQFSVTLQRTIPSVSGNVGSLTLGALPNGVVNSSFAWMPVRRYTPQQNGIAVAQAPGETYPYAWEVPLDAVYFGGVRLSSSTLGDVSQNGVGHSALIDTGNSLIRGPADVIVTILAMLVNSTSTPSPFTNPGSFDASVYSEEEYASFTEGYDSLPFAYPCEEAYSLEFEFSGQRFQVDPRDFGRPVDDSEHFCVPNLAPTDPPQLGGYLYSWSLGEPFLRGVLASFYYGNLTHPSSDPPRIGFLSTVPDDAALQLDAAVQSAEDVGGCPETTTSAPIGTFVPNEVTTNTQDIAQGSEPPTSSDVLSSAVSIRQRLRSGASCFLCLAFGADFGLLGNAIFCALFSIIGVRVFI
ncbi:hypothetical protein ACEPAG_8878 [Sanghuangporus baumii]